MNLNNLKSKYDKLLKDEDFDKLDLGIKNPNIFQILRITKTEIRHSNFLSWLLDSNQSHKLGDIFLKRFLREVFSSDKFTEIEQVDVEGMDLTKVEIQREWNNIDILIKLENVVVCIENKVLSKEHSNQLKKYKDILNSHFPNDHQIFVYLTPEGINPENEIQSYEPLSYGFIVESLNRILSVYGESLNEQVRIYIKDYINVIKRELMGTDKLTELSRKIYQNHKELFDFIYEHKPDLVDELVKIVKEEIVKRGWILGSENKNYVRFLTPKIQDLIYYNTEPKKGWGKKESFLFELPINVKSKQLHFKTCISPSDLKYDTGRLEEILLEINGSKKSPYKQWLSNIEKKEEFNYDEIHFMTDEEIRISVNNFFDEITPIIEKVENKFLEHEKELIQMKTV